MNTVSIASAMLFATSPAPLPDGADAWASPRPFGAVMGDGLHLQTDPLPPAGGGVRAGGETQVGIDVSYYQGDIDWPAVAEAAVTFAINVGGAQEPDPDVAFIVAMEMSELGPRLPRVACRPRRVR